MTDDMYLSKQQLGMRMFGTLPPPYTTGTPPMRTPTSGGTSNAPSAGQAISSALGILPGVGPLISGIGGLLGGISQIRNSNAQRDIADKQLEQRRQEIKMAQDEGYSPFTGRSLTPLVRNIQ